MTIEDIQDKKTRGEKITVLTAYDFSFARLIDQAEIDVILVGDSLANVVLGLPGTRAAAMEEMIHHAKAVRRGVRRALLVGDMPYEAYQPDPSLALKNARRFRDEAGCQAVKVEWFDERVLGVIKDLVEDHIPVMGHAGLTPQTAEALGGFKVQGKDRASAEKILKQAVDLEKAGCFALVLECVPADLAEEVTRTLKIPTIGIGAGIHCDGQVMVMHDLLGLTSGHRPKFVKAYADLAGDVRRAVERYKTEVESGIFPDDGHSYH